MDFGIIIHNLPQYLEGALVTLEISGAALCAGIMGGLLVAMCRMSKISVIRWVASGYISVIRGTPLLLQIILIFYSLPSLGITLSAMTSGILALSINIAAYMAETIRGGINAVPKGQSEAAHALGYSNLQRYRYIILPQTIKIILPQVGNTAISILKDSSMVSVITITELMRTAQVSYAITFKPLEAYLLAAILYYAMSCVVSRVFIMLEKRMNRY